MEPERKEIIDYVLKTGLVETCIQYRLNKCTNNYFKEELAQETWFWLLNYDISKLTDAYNKKHLSALITRFICNQFFSKTSPFYKIYKKLDLNSDEITERELCIPDPDTE